MAVCRRPTAAPRRQATPPPRRIRIERFEHQNIVSRMMVAWPGGPPPVATPIGTRTGHGYRRERALRRSGYEHRARDRDRARGQKARARGRPAFKLAGVAGGGPAPDPQGVWRLARPWRR